MHRMLVAYSGLKIEDTGENPECDVRNKLAHFVPLHAAIARIGSSCHLTSLDNAEDSFHYCCARKQASCMNFDTRHELVASSRASSHLGLQDALTKY